MHKVTLFETEARLLIQARGFLCVEQAHAVHEDVRRCLNIARSFGRPLRVLGDLSEFAIQNLEVTTIFIATAELMRNGPVERHAVVHRHMMQRLQNRRVLGRNDVGEFYSIEDAAHWLDWPMAELSPVLWAAPGGLVTRAA